MQSKTEIKTIDNENTLNVLDSDSLALPTSLSLFLSSSLLFVSFSEQFDRITTYFCLSCFAADFYFKWINEIVNWLKRITNQRKTCWVHNQVHCKISNWFRLFFWTFSINPWMVSSQCSLKKSSFSFDKKSDFLFQLQLVILFSYVFINVIK